MKDNIPIGFSTKCFDHSERDLARKVSYFERAGATAIEIDFTIDCLSLCEDISSELVKRIRSFQHISLYAPTNVCYRETRLTEDTIERLKTLSKLFKNCPVIFHPLSVEDFGWLESFGLDILLTNMDDGKRNFRWPQSFLDVLSGHPNFGLALNMQHAYDNDRNMEPAYLFLDELRDRIRLVHFSGHKRTDDEQDFPHWPVSNSGNGDTIRQKVHEFDLQVPHIAQGYFDPNLYYDYDSALKSELKYIRAPSQIRPSKRIKMKQAPIN